MKKNTITTIGLMLLTVLGFCQDFNSTRNATKEITSCTGNIYDHGGPNGDYTTGGIDTIIVNSNQEGMGVQIRVESSDLWPEPGNQDQVIYIGGLDVADGVGNKIAFGLAGSNGQGDFYLRSRRADGSVKLIFDAVPEGNGAGFHYSIGCFTLPTGDDVLIPNAGNQVHTNCNTIILDDGVEIITTAQIQVGPLLFYQKVLGTRFS